MTNGQTICLYVFGAWVVLFLLAVLVGRFLRVGSKPVPRERVVEREWERAS